MGKEDRSCCEDFFDFFKKYVELQRVVCSNEIVSSGFIKIDMFKIWMIWFQLWMIIFIQGKFDI